MTHWAIVSGEERGEPYILAAADRKEIEAFITPNGEMRVVSAELGQKFVIIPERNIVVLGHGMSEALNEARHEILTCAQTGVSMRQMIEVGGRKLAEKMQDLLRRNICLELNSNRCASSIVVASIKDEAEVAIINYEPMGLPQQVLTLFDYGFAYLHASDYVREVLRNVPEKSIPFAAGIEVIIRSHEQARINDPDLVSEELDVLLLAPNRNPAKLQIGYEGGRPVVKRAKPITKTFVPWEAGNRSGFHMFNNAVAD